MSEQVRTAPGSRVVKAASVRTVVHRRSETAAQRVLREQAEQLQQARQAAFQDGYAEGVAHAQAAGSAAAERGAGALDALVVAVATQRTEELAEGSAAVLRAALEVAEWVLRREVSTDGAALLDRLETALATLLPSPTTRIAVSPADYPLVASWAEGRGRVGTTVVSDVRLPAGDAVVTTDAGLAEATLTAALRTAAEALGVESRPAVSA